MAPYQITTIATTATGRTEVTIQGPGIEAAGRRYLFGNRAEADGFVEALNFAFGEGYREGLATRPPNRGS